MSEERKMILEMLAERKISAEEAVELLRALGLPDAASGGTGRPMPPAQPRPESFREAPEPGDEEPRRRSGAQAGAAGRSILEDILSRINVRTDFDWGNLPFALGGEAYRFEDEYRGEFTADGPVELDFQTRNGRVELFGWSEPGWRVIIRKKIRAQDETKAKERAAEIAKFEQFPGRLVFRELSTGLSNSGVSLEVHLPRGLTYKIRAQSSNGRVIVEKLDAQELLCKAANGKVLVQEVSATTADLASANGSISFEGSAGTLECDTANGSIALCPAPKTDMSCRLRTTNGSIRITVPEDARIGYSMDAHTGHGGLEVSIPGFETSYQEKQFGRRRLTGRSSGYAGRELKVEIAARTTNGSVRVSSAPGGAKCPPGDREDGPEQPSS